jgi:hypothetical protein
MALSLLPLGLQLLLAAAGPEVPVSATVPGSVSVVLSGCIHGATNQSFVAHGPTTAKAFGSVYNGGVAAGGLCLDLATYRTNAARDRPPQLYGGLARPRLGSMVDAWPCAANAWVNQYWAVARNSTLETLQPDSAGLCLGVSASGAALADCSSPPAQFNVGFKHGDAPTLPPDGPLVHKQSGLCVTLAGVVPPAAPAPPPRPPDPPNTPCPAVRPPPPLPPSVRAAPSAGARPCDIYTAGGTPCVAAHSMVRALYSSFDGPLYLVQRSSDYTNITIGVLQTGGVANAAAQEQFCAGTDCEVLIIFDQSPQGNHLFARHPGRDFPCDYGVNASAQPILIAADGGSSQRVYGSRFDPGELVPAALSTDVHRTLRGMGYRNDHATGLAVGDAPQSIYAVMGGGHYNDHCCFDYGNAERRMTADGAGTMEALYFGNATLYWKERAKIPSEWHGAYIMADLEAGMYGGNDTLAPSNSPIDHDFNTLMLKGRTCEMALKAGNAQAGDLTTKYNGGRPTHADYHPMRKQGGLILGTGGDNSDSSRGIFYEVSA